LILLVFYAVLRVLFFKPLLRVIAEREARTIGAQKAAEEAQKAAAEKVKQYQDALKQARTEIYVEQEAARKKVLDERAALLKEARAKTAARVNAERERIEAEVLAARREIESSITQFSPLVARRVLQSTRPPSAPSGESR
jgi:F-type H+-transporting ATPase subunit b